ncbi:MAG: right-handed parallel beta-helix repeat-containing protein [Myxococcota bacterium]
MWSLAAAVLLVGGLGGTDDRAAIQAALDRAGARGGGVVQLPPGVFHVARRDASTTAVLTIPSGVTLRGAGASVTELRLAAGQPDFTRVIELTDVEDVEIRDLSIDGNRGGHAAGEHRAGVFATRASNVRLERVALRNHTGDGVELFEDTRNVTLHDCVLADNDRNGVTFDGVRSSGHRIVDSYFYGIGAQAIDSEVTAEGSVHDVEIVGNTIVHHGGNYAITTGGSSAEHRNRGWTIAENRIEGSIYLLWGQGVLVRGNTIESQGFRAPIETMRDVRDVRIEGNRIEGHPSDSLGGIFVAHSAGESPRRIAIVDNTIAVRAAAAAVVVQGVRGTRVVDNRITVGHAKSRHVHLQATATMDEIEVRRNALRGDVALDDAIVLFGSSTFGTADVAIVDNVVETSQPPERTMRIVAGMRYERLVVRPPASR